MGVRFLADGCVTLCGVADITEDGRLTSAERELVRSASSPHRARELGAGRLAAALAFEALSVTARPSVLSDVSGRPLLDPPSPWFVSLAHDGGKAGAAVSSRPVGLDIVDLKRSAQVERAVRGRLQDHGAAPLVGAAARFPETMLLWSAWEALGKKSGGGVLSGPMSVPIGPLVSDGELLLASARSDQVRWWSEEGVLLCLATSGSAWGWPGANAAQ